MKRDTLSAIKFRGITSSVLAICTYLIIWACCEFWHDVEISKFLGVAAVIVVIIFTSMIFKLSATKIISDISDSKVFRTYLITFIARVLWTIMVIAFLLYAINIASSETLNYFFHSHRESFVDTFYSVIRTTQNIGFSYQNEATLIAIWSNIFLAVIPALKTINYVVLILVYYKLGKAVTNKIFYFCGGLYFMYWILLNIMNVFVNLPKISNVTAVCIILIAIFLSEILELIAWIRIKGISGAELWNKTLWTTPTK